jgi:hypothetical protein
MAYVRIKKEKIFINRKDQRRSPRIIGKRKVDASNNIKGSALEEPLEFLKIQLACPVDQRKILTEDIGSIRVFLSFESHELLKRRFDILNPDAPRILNSKPGSADGITSRGPAGRSLERRATSRDPRDGGGALPMAQSSALGISAGIEKIKEKKSSAVKAARFTKVVSDIDFLNQRFNEKKFSKLKKICEVNVNQELVSRKVSQKDYKNKK